MQELKKILEEIEQLVNMHYEDDSVKTIIFRNLRGIRKHMSGKDTGVPTNDGWIPVEERLPEDETMMLVTCRTKTGRRSVNRAWYGAGCWHGTGSMSGVTAWMPLPEPYCPKKESEDSRRLREREEFFKG